LTEPDETAIIPALMHLAISEFFKTPVFWSAFLAYVFASFLKMIGNFRKTGKIDFQYLTTLGGMPSAHSAMVGGLATSVGMREGFGSTIFAVTFAFAVVVMFDASTVRRATGLQARLLNQIIDEVFKNHHLSAQKLIEILGHTRLEVGAGLAVGITIGMLISAIML
jgi:acid phosphatase family membrane protein YuiD